MAAEPEGGRKRDRAGPPPSDAPMKRAKIDALWQRLNSHGSGKSQRQSSGGGNALSLQAQLHSDPRAASLGGLSALVAGLNSKKVCQQGSTTATRPRQKDSSLQAILGGLQGVKPAAVPPVDVRAAAAVASKIAKPVATGSEPAVSSVPQESLPAAGPPKPALVGLDAALAGLQKKKATVLGNTKQDWKQFKEADADVNEELENYKKSNDKYLDKVDFLKRAELKEYEKERDARLARRPARSDVPASP